MMTSIQSVWDDYFTQLRDRSKDHGLIVERYILIRENKDDRSMSFGYTWTEKTDTDLEPARIVEHVHNHDEFQKCLPSCKILEWVLS